MPNVTLNLSISEEDFNKIMVDQIDKIPEDILQPILVESIKAVLNTDKGPNYGSRDSNILVTREPGTYSDHYKPTDVLNNIINKIDFDKYMSPICDAVGKYIIENYHDLILETVTKIFLEQLFGPDAKHEMMQRIMYEVNTKDK